MTGQSPHGLGEHNEKITVDFIDIVFLLLAKWSVFLEDA